MYLNFRVFQFTNCKAILILLISIALLTNFVKAQNLVPNPSFEEKWECPAGGWTIMTCKEWSSVMPANGDQWTNTNSVPDYFNACSSCFGYYNYAGYQLPRTGLAYSDICAYFGPNPNERIYLEVRLNSPLKKDQIYKVSYFAALINKAEWSSPIGAYLSIDKFVKADYFALQLVPHIESNGQIRDTLNWTEVSGNYKAEGGEEYLTIGNFYDDANSHFIFLGSNAFLTNYYIDDVSVIACDTCEKEILNNFFIPDAFSPNADGNNDKLFVRGNNIQELYFAVYDRWGEKVFETTDKNIGWDGTYKGQELSGAVFVYYCTGKYMDGKEFKQKGDVTLVR